MSVVFRYLFSETVRTWLIIASVLVVLTLGLGLSRYIGAAAEGRLPVDTVAMITVLSIARAFDIIMPFSVLLALMLVVGRLCRDNEMAALMAGGAGLSAVYRPFILLAVGVAVFSGVMSIVVTPVAQKKINQLGAKSAANALQAITPGRFASFDGGRVTFYARSRDDDGVLHHVFIRVLQTHEGRPKQIIVTAQTAHQVLDEKQGVTLVLNDGWRYDGEPGQADYRMIQFREHGIRLQQNGAVEKHDIDAMSTLELIQRDDNKSKAKLQTRFSVPLSIIILALIALPIGRAPPRSGRYGRIILGILFFVIYLDLVRLSGQAVENGLLPAWIGEWWVHILVFGIAVFLIARENGIFVRRRRSGAMP